MDPRVERKARREVGARCIPAPSDQVSESRTTFHRAPTKESSKARLIPYSRRRGSLAILQSWVYVYFRGVLIFVYLVFFLSIDSF